MRIRSLTFVSPAASRHPRPATSLLLSTWLLAFFWALTGPAAQAQGTLDRAKTYFDQARKSHSELQQTPIARRTIADYNKLIRAFRLVYLTAPTYGNSTISLMAIGELSEEAARRWSEPKYFQQAMEAYTFLLREYPQSQFRFDARLALARIYQHDLRQPQKALEQFERYLADYPKSPQAKLARQAMVQLRDEIGPMASGEAALLSKSPAEKAPAAKTASDAPGPNDPLATITDIRYWTNPETSRVVVDVGRLGEGRKLKYQVGRLSTPPRIYIDLYDAQSPRVSGGRTLEVNGDLLKRVRMAQFDPRTARLVLDLGSNTDYEISEMTNPYRLVIDVRSRTSEASATSAVAANPQTATPPPAGRAALVSPAQTPLAIKFPKVPAAAAATPRETKPAEQSAKAPVVKEAPAIQAVRADAIIEPARQLKQDAAVSPAATGATQNSKVEVAVQAEPAVQQASPTAGPDLTAPKASASSAPASPVLTAAASPSLVAAVAPAPGKPDTKPDTKAAAAPATMKPTADPGSRTAAPIRGGMHSLTRALGLKVGRIFIDAGHGGNDTGTIGPGGLTEKELALDVAQRLGKLIEGKLGSEVVLSREDDSFVPLEDRVAMANHAEADLFLSIHLNSSAAKNAAGIETYYLNFTSDPEALKVAARENAGAQETIANLPGIVRKIALQEKLDESREFAARVQASLRTSLAKGMNRKNANQFDRGVKTAPFVVLIGASMPSILAEVSFLSNPAEEKRLRTPEHRQKIAEALFAGVASYVDTMSGVKVGRRQ